LIADACEEVWGVLDGTKWHSSALLSFISMGDLTGIVTDPSAPAADILAWRAADIAVIVADAGR
jgi:DeoR/GlpR family transcriptional regulator of sugar metabolism